MMNFKFVEGRLPFSKMSSPLNHTHQPYNLAVLPITERLRVEAREISLGGDFNDWQPDKHRLKKQPDGFWRSEIEVPPPGKYRYKFLIEGNRWIEDASHALKEADGFGGFNSVLFIA